jgi:hydroxymethylpyrimidine/phosphomethylpyrimidine kinase
LSSPPIILSIAGSDSSSGAGIQGDLKTITALGGYAVSVITCVTSQNTLGVQSVFSLPKKVVTSQLVSIKNDFDLAAVKIGMLFNCNNIQIVENFLDKLVLPNVVLDPVFKSTFGQNLIKKNVINQLIEKLFSKSTVITPNIPEVINILDVINQTNLKSQLKEALVNEPDKLISCFKKCAKVFSSYGNAALLIKGGHMLDWKIPKNGNRSEIFDFLFHKDEFLCLRKEKILTKNTHGSGCILSSAIATNLGLGDTLEHAVKNAQKFVHKSIVSSKNLEIGNGNGPINHFFA